MDIKAKMGEYRDSLVSMDEMYASIYDVKFKDNFELVNVLYERMQSKTNPITDSELSEILTTLPLNLFKISEKLNELRLNREVIKLQNYDKKAEFTRKISVECELECEQYENITKSEKKKAIADRIKLAMAENDVIVAVYDAVIERVESEVSFSRELIMGAKKIWDARRNAEKANPVAPVVPEQTPDDLPNYIVQNPLANKTYIK